MARPRKNEAIAKFLLELARCGNVTQAARKAKLGREALYLKRRKEPDFKAAWDEAATMGVDALEDEARRRAYEGWKEPVYKNGEKVGTVTKFSDTLLIFLLKGAKPEKYRETVDMKVSGELNVTALEKARERAKQNV